VKLLAVERAPRDHRRVLTPLQKSAVVLTAVTVPLFVVAVSMILLTPGEGANIGAGMVLLLVLVCSFVAAALFLVSPGRGARPAAVTSVVLWLAYLALAPTDAGPRWLAIALASAAVLALVAGAAGTVLGGRGTRATLG
jgi:hypothetical protein